jgi:hypothetical protein
MCCEAEESAGMHTYITHISSTTVAMLRRGSCGLVSVLALDAAICIGVTLLARLLGLSSGVNAYNSNAVVRVPATVEDACDT